MPCKQEKQEEADARERVLEVHKSIFDKLRIASAEEGDPKPVSFTDMEVSAVVMGLITIKAFGDMLEETEADLALERRFSRAVDMELSAFLLGGVTNDK